MFSNSASRKKAVDLLHKNIKRREQSDAYINEITLQRVENNTKMPKLSYCYDRSYACDKSDILVYTRMSIETNVRARANLYRHYLHVCTYIREIHESWFLAFASSRVHQLRRGFKQTRIAPYSFLSRVYDTKILLLLVRTFCTLAYFFSSECTQWLKRTFTQPPATKLYTKRNIKISLPDASCMKTMLFGERFYRNILFREK